MSGQWFYSRFRKSKRHRKTNEVITGSQLVKASFRRRPHEEMNGGGKHPVRPTNTGRLSHAGVMLGQRRRRWSNINPACDERFVFAETTMSHLPMQDGMIIFKTWGLKCQPKHSHPYVCILFSLSWNVIFITQYRPPIMSQHYWLDWSVQMHFYLHLYNKSRLY